MFRSTRLNQAKSGGGGNRTRDLGRWVRLNEATFLRNLIFASLYFALVAVAVVGTGGAHDAREPHPSIVICDTFGKRYCGEALRVAWCESRFDTSATNGQYRGLFQMGSWERRRYGHGSTASAQSRAALRYFRVSGRDWSPWDCRP